MWILLPLGFFAALVTIAWLIGRVIQARVVKQADTQQQLLAKFGSGRELAEFMETEGGRQFMRQFESNPDRMILGSLSSGVVFSFLGMGFFGLMTRDSDFLTHGVITLALGIGLIVAAIVSRRLSERWQPAE